MVVIVALREKCPYSELCWSTFSRIRSEYGKIVDISPYSVRMRENAAQNNSEYGRALFTQCGIIKKNHSDEKFLLKQWKYIFDFVR